MAADALEDELLALGGRQDDAGVLASRAAGDALRLDVACDLFETVA